MKKNEKTIFQNISPEDRKGRKDWEKDKLFDSSPVQKKLKGKIHENYSRNKIDEKTIFRDVSSEDRKGRKDWEKDKLLDNSPIQKKLKGKIRENYSRNKNEVSQKSKGTIFPYIPPEDRKDRKDWEKEYQTDIISDKNHKKVFPKEKNTVNKDKCLIEMPYLVAQEFCKKYKLKHFFPEEADNDIWLFKKNAGYDYIDEEKLSTLIYDMLPNELKLRIKNIASYIKNVIGFIYKEMAINPVNASLNVGKCFSPEDFEKIKYHALFQNGVYDLRRNELHPHFNAGYPYYLPIQAKYIGKPIDYLLYHAENFQKLLRDTTDGDKDTMEMIMAYLAYFVIPYKNREIVFITGPTASGKSIFADLIDALMPPGRVSSMNITDFGGRFSLGNASKYLLINGRDVEINSGGTAALKPKDISVLKQCSGDSIITTEAKGKMPHVTHIIFKLLFASNGPVIPAHPDSAYEDRVTLLPFMQSVPKKQRDPELGQKVLAEKDYIITLCMRKLKKCIDERGNIILPVSEQAQKLKNTWFQYTDFIEKFIDNKIHFTGNKEDFVKNKEIFEEYKKYYIIERTDTVRSSIAKQEDVLEKILCTGMGQAKLYRKDNKRGILGILLK